MKADLQAILEHYGVRTRHGIREQAVRCPVHGDSHPSMSVNLDKGVAVCYACGFGGSGIDLVMEVEGLTFQEAKEFLESEGIEIGAAREDESNLRPYQRKSRSGRKGGYVPPWRRGGSR